MKNRSPEEIAARMSGLKAGEKAAKAEYEELRDELLSRMTAERFSTQIFVGENGEKVVAYRVDPTPIDVDLNLLEFLVDDEVFAAVTEPKLVTAAFWQAVKTGKISSDVALRCSRQRAGTSHIRFSSPEDYAKNAEK